MATAEGLICLAGAIILLGNALCAVLQAPRQYLLPLGLAAVSVLVTTSLMTFDATILQTRYALLAVCVASLYCSREFVVERRSTAVFIASFAAIFGVLALPALVGGAQFYVFRGNWWDHFNYLAGVEAITDHRASVLRHLTPQMVQSDPITAYASASIDNRPAVVLLAAVFRPRGADLFAFGYLFLAFLLSLAGSVLIGVVSDLKARVHVGWVLLAAAIPVGFWGQLLIDLSVWSHIACFPLLASMFSRDMLGYSRDDYRFDQRAIWLLVLWLAAFLLYPEGAMVVAAIRIGGAVFAMRSIRPALQLGALLAISIVVAGLIDYRGSVGFFARQAASGVDSTKLNASWYLYSFQQYLGYNFTAMFGDQIAQLKALTIQHGPFALASSILRSNPAFVLLPLNFVPIILGFYPLIHPLTQTSIVLGAATSLVMIAVFAVLTYQLVRHPGTGDAGTAYLRRHAALLLVPSVALMLLFLARLKIWEFGKFLTFVVPCLAPLYFSIVWEKDWGGNRVLRRCAHALVILFVAMSGVFAVQRVVLASRVSGIGHDSPFPSIIHAVDKQQFRYAIPRELQRCSSVAVAETHPNRSVYLLLASRQHGPARLDHTFMSPSTGVDVAPSAAIPGECSIEFKESAVDSLSRPVLTGSGG